MMEMNDAKVMLALKGTSTFRHVEKGDFVISLRSFEGGIEYSAYAGCVSPAYTVLAARKNIANEYYKFLFKSGPFVAALQSTTDGLRDGKAISYTDFGTLKIPYPPLAEQQQIAAFLDYETAKIDALIEKQQQLIALLGEKRQAVISHAVTKGLNPNAPMRDSGVEWLGMVPKHWKVSKVGHQTQIYRGKFTYRPRNEPRFYGGRHPFIQTGDVSNSSKFITEYTQTLNDKGFLISREFPKGTLCMVITGAKTGSVAILDFVACFPDSIVGFYPKYGEKGAEYLFYAFQALKQYLDSVAVVSTQENLNVERISGAIWAWPPPEEQVEIAKHLVYVLERMKLIEQKSELLVELLQERRTALISAAVTGKIDVRDWKLPATDRPLEAEMEGASW